MHEGNSEEVEKMINFDKLRMLAKYVLDLTDLTDRAYTEKPDEVSEIDMKVSDIFCRCSKRIWPPRVQK
jgi:hypothetical protein